MKKDIRITIEKPCHENFSSFKKTSNGGFCGSCQKEVIDFTSWSDDRIKLYFKNLPANTCGRFQKRQLKLYSYDKCPSRPTAWLSLLFGGLLLLFTSRQAAAQGNPPKQTTEQYHEESKIGEVSPTGLNVIKVNGVVKSLEDGTVMPGVSVLCKGSVQGTMTDVDGRFYLVLENLQTPAALIFSFIGYEATETLVDIDKSEQTIKVEMMPALTSLGEIVVGGATARWYSPRRMWWRVKRIFW